MSMTEHRILGSRTLSDEQKVVLVLCKTVTATLSLIASAIIIYKIYLRHRKNQSKSSTVTSGSLRSLNDTTFTTYHRILLSISILDVIHSTSSALSSLLVPSYTNSTFAHGNTATCSVQGSLQQLTTSIVIYMAMLNMYFMLKIRYNISDSVINRRYEIWFHAIPITHFLSTAVTGLSMGIFGPMNLPELGCWLDSYCAYRKICTRSSPVFYKHVGAFAWAFAYIWLFVSVILVAINAVLIYTAIRRQERRNAKYLGAVLQKEGAPSLSSVSNKNRVTEFKEREDTNAAIKGDEIRPAQSSELMKNEKTEAMFEESAFFESVLFSKPLTPNNTSTNDEGKRRANAVKYSRVAAVQSLLYVSSALFTAIWIFMPWVGNKLQVEASARFFFAFMVNLVSPSQGMFNLFVFVRLHYLRLRETNEDWSRWKCVKECLFSAD